MPQGLVVLLLAMLLGIQPVTTDLYLPALPALTASFSAPVAQAQQTLSALLLAFGVSQLVWGPLSDRFGRRPILLMGLAAYLVAAIGSTLAPSMAQLIVWRALQGAAMGAVVMCARALVRDLYQPQDGARIMSKGLSGLGALACISAPVGGLLAQPLADTLKSEVGGRVGSTLDRSGKWLAQTPQMFRIGPLLAALDAAARAQLTVTDESSAMEAAGHQPQLVPGSAQNFKVTWPEDFALAEAVLRTRQQPPPEINP